MHYEYFITNDNVKLAYQTSVSIDTAEGAVEKPQAPQGQPRACILLLHGFSGSSDYFSRNTPQLSQSHWVLAPDMRGHGKSEQVSHGYHVARLATDLYELIKHVQSRHPATAIYAVGCSIGAAVLWTYVELFTDRDFHGLVFVDQAPLQNRSAFGGGWGPGLAHFGCYDETTMLEAQRCWGSEDVNVREETYRGLVESCLGYRCSPMSTDTVTSEQSRMDEEFFVAISKVCDGKWLARLLGDHTGYDHREAIELITKPVLVLAGKRSGCFSVEGMMETVRRAEANKAGNARGVVFDSGHWLFWEEPEKFNQELIGFVERCQS